MREPGRKLQGEIFRDEASPLAAAIGAQDRETLSMVADALRLGRVRLAWQPVVMGAAPDRVGFHEGLVRVLDDRGRTIPARDFMASVETTDIGRQIDCAVLDIGLATLRARSDLRLSLNMSARSIGYPAWQRTLKRGLGGNAAAGERLILELDEASVLQVPELVMAFMDEVRPAGVTFLLDDFGAEASSFRVLRDFCFDMAKIDGQFVRGLAGNPDNQAVVRALIATGRHFDMLTVAESVERAEDASWLQAQGIGAMQGYLFGVPALRPDWRPDWRPDLRPDLRPDAREGSARKRA